MTLLTYYCWHCYADSDQPSGRCTRCGEAIAAPADVGFTERLVWALRHPVAERRLLAAQVLGERRDRSAVGSLRQAALGDDPYLAAQALSSLMTIDPAGSIEQAERLARTAAAPVRAAAHAALAHARRRRPAR